MSKIVSKVEGLQDRYVIRDIRRERKGYLSLYSFGVDGTPWRWEFMDRGAAVVVLPVDFRREEVYLIEQPRHNKAFVCDATLSAAREHARDTGKADGAFIVEGKAIHVIDVPAGMIEEGESIERTALRELEEETGMVVDEKHLRLVTSYFTSIGGSTERHFAFIADVSDVEHRDAVGDGSERIHTQVMSWKEAFALVREGRIESASAAVMLRELMLIDLESRLHRSHLPVD